MRAALKATAVLGSVSAANIAGSLVSAKVTALLLGPGGVGYMGLLQGLVALTVLIAGMGVGAALVRDGARALAEGDARRMAALRRAGWGLALGFGLAALIALVLLRTPVGAVMLGGAEREGAVVVMGAAAFLSLLTGLQTSILNAHHRVADLARAGVIGVVCNVAATILLIWWLRERGIVAAVAAGFAANWLVSFLVLRLRLPGGPVPAAPAEVRAAAGALLRFGLPFTASSLVGAGVLMILPAMVLHALGPVEVGYYRAAAAISINYLGFILLAMAQDYYPRVSAAQGAEALNRLINEQLRLVLLLAGPVILGMLALVPWLVPLVYASSFAPAGEVLEWQLIGDLFKFAGWTMAFVILAARGSAVFFWTELFGGTLLLAASWLGMRWLGLEGLGIAFLLSSAASCALCWLVLRRAQGLAWSPGNVALFLVFAAAMGLVRSLPALGLAAWRMPVALTLAAVLGCVSVRLIWRTFGGWQALGDWRKRRA